MCKNGRNGACADLDQDFVLLSGAASKCSFQHDLCDDCMYYLVRILRAYQCTTLEIEMLG